MTPQLAGILLAIMTVTLLILLFYPRKKYKCSGCSFVTTSASKALQHAQNKHIVE